MADTFTAVDLSRLPAPLVVEALSYEQIYAAMLAQLQLLLPGFDATVESDPAVKLLQVVAYRELLLRARVNDAARAVMPAFATGADLDQLAALLGVARLQLVPANALTGAPAVLETDEDFRRRFLLAPEGFSVAGPEGAYIFHALSASPEVLDASVTSPSPGEVVVTILPRDPDLNNGPLLANVQAYLTAESRRPLTDHVTTQLAQIVGGEIFAEITTFAGPDSAIVLAEARRRLGEYLAENYRLGRDITISGLFAALHVPGVQTVQMPDWGDDMPVSRTQAARFTDIVLIHKGTGE
jgi:phage-related baseplate assembly protein